MPRRCFYVSGFHEKTDLATGRKLNLDRTYAVIKRVVEGLGMECVRADEIRHSGTIDLPMFRQLLEADLVIADLSTANVNAAYELGVRHALRPARTVIIAEDQFAPPFDVNHIAIWPYEHLGKDIGTAEAERIQRELAEHLSALMKAEEPDSPVYLFLENLQPPASGAEVAGEAPARRGLAEAEPQTVAAVTDLAMRAKDEKNFSKAEGYLKDLVGTQPNDVYLRQQLALVTYKSEEPTPVEALERAAEVLQPLHPDTTRDTETVGLWAAIQKRHWEKKPDPETLTNAIRGLEKIYALQLDWYNGINLAFLLDARAAIGAATDRETDRLQATWVRRRVIPACQAEYDQRRGDGEFDKVPAERERSVREAHYWLLATLREANVGLGNGAEAARWAQLANEQEPEDWMLDSTEEQIEKLLRHQGRSSAAED